MELRNPAIRGIITIIAFNRYEREIYIMTRRFIKLMALVCVIALTLTGCNLIRVDEKADLASVVASFKGGTVTKGEVIDTYNNTLAYYNNLSAYYGVQVSTDGVLENVVEHKVREKVLANKAQELGIAALSEEQEATVKEESDTEFEDAVQSCWSQYAEEGLTDEEIRAAIEKYLADDRHVTKQMVIDEHVQEQIESNLTQYVYAGVKVLPEEIQDKFNELVAADESSYADIAAFENAVTNGTKIYWMPEGYRTVKQILLLFTDEQREVLSDLEAKITNAETSIDEITSKIEAGEAPEEVEGEETVSYEDQLAALKEELEVYKTDLTAETEKYAAELQERVDEILAKISEDEDLTDEDFDALVAEYGEDNGMKTEPGMTQGYYVSANSTAWLKEFTDASMALKEIGDVSEPFTSIYGVHIVRYYSDVPAGAVSYDSVSSDLETEVLTEKQQKEFDDQVAAWITEADVKYDYSSMAQG